MTTALTKNETATASKASPLAALASRLTVDPNKLLQVMKATVIKGKATDEEVIAFTIVANTYQLNPLVREIYAFASQQAGVVPIVSVDGWSKIVNRRDDFDGCEFSTVEDDSGKPVSTTCTIWVKDRGRPVSVTEYWSECKRNTPMWATMPRRMLRHKAFIQCARLAFGLGGIYDEDEAKDILRNSQPADPAAPAPTETTEKAADVIARKRKKADAGEEPDHKEIAPPDANNGDLFPDDADIVPDDDDDVPM